MFIGVVKDLRWYGRSQVELHKDGEDEHRGQAGRHEEKCNEGVYQ